MMLLSQLLINLGFARLAWGYNPDSRLAKNVLEEYRDGYCSVSLQQWTDPLMTALWTDRIDELFVRIGGIPQRRPLSRAT